MEQAEAPIAHKLKRSHVCRECAAGLQLHALGSSFRAQEVFRAFHLVTSCDVLCWSTCGLLPIGVIIRSCPTGVPSLLPFSFGVVPCRGVSRRQSQWPACARCSGSAAVAIAIPRLARPVEVAPVAPPSAGPSLTTRVHRPPPRWYAARWQCPLSLSPRLWRGPRGSAWPCSCWHWLDTHSRPRARRAHRPPLKMSYPPTRASLA